jgi:hypothetical protein
LSYSFVAETGQKGEKLQDQHESLGGLNGTSTQGTKGGML